MLESAAVTKHICPYSNHKVLLWSQPSTTFFQWPCGLSTWSWTNCRRTEMFLERNSWTPLLFILLMETLILWPPELLRALFLVWSCQPTPPGGWQWFWMFSICTQSVWQVNRGVLNAPKVFFCNLFLPGEVLLPRSLEISLVQAMTHFHNLSRSNIDSSNQFLFSSHHCQPMNLKKIKILGKWWW